MKALYHAGLAVFVVVTAPALSAQWPSWPTSGVPKTPDGKPNLTAPAPKTADGHPDLSGLWENEPMFPRGAGAGVGGAAGAPRADGTIAPRASKFWDIGYGMKEGLPIRPSAAELLKQRDADNSKDNPDAHCLPMGFMQFHMHPQPRKIVQTKDLIVVIYESNYGLRQIFLDGRPLPANDPQPWWYGYSVGKWDGDTLVVETTGLKGDGWLDIIGTPFTEAAKVTERFRRVNYGTLHIDITVDDATAYTKPWTVGIDQHIMLNNELIEFICLENEKSSPHFQ